MKLIKKR